MLHEHLTHVLPLASQAAALGPAQFRQAAKILQDGPSGVLLPELAIGLVLLQLRLPLQLVESDCIPLVGELVDCLDQFNRLAPGAHMEDEDDLAWSDVKSKHRLSYHFSLHNLPGLVVSACTRHVKIMMRFPSDRQSVVHSAR